MNLEQIIEGFASQNRRALAKAITLAESSRAEDQKELAELLSRLEAKRSGKSSIRIGVSGSPGAGKSTLLETLGGVLITQGKKVCVLAVDPSSSKTGGSILGDKTRMSTLSSDPRAFVRPSPSIGHHGGVAPGTREVILLCEAFGFDVLFVETVGVGQSEIEVMEMVDLFLLLLLPHAGDDLQGIKKGVMEVADLIFVNKADLEPEQSTVLRSQLENALHFFRPKHKFWKVPVLTGSALHETSMLEILKEIDKFIEVLEKNGSLQGLRKRQLKDWFMARLKRRVWQDFLEKNDSDISELHEKIERGELSVLQALSSFESR